MRCVPLCWRSVLKDDRHEGLANGALPCLRHLASYATVRCYLARWGRRLQDSLWVAWQQWGESVWVLPYKVAHGGCDELKAVGIGALRNKSEVGGWTQLQNLRQRDLLQDRQESQVLLYSSFYNQSFSMSNRRLHIGNMKTQGDEFTL